MVDRPLPDLSPAARDILRSFRAEQSPAAADRRRNWSALGSRLDAPTEVSFAEGRVQRYAKIVAVTMALAAGVLLAVKLVSLGVTTLSDRAREPAMEAPYQGVVDRGSKAASQRSAKPGEGEKSVRAEPRESAGLEEPEPEPSPIPVAPAAAPASERSRPTPARVPIGVSSDLQAELLLIKKATRAKQAGDNAAALAALREHAQRFRAGTFADERRVMRAEVLCASGRRSEAQAEVRRFLQTRSRSALAGRMREVCKN